MNNSLKAISDRARQLKDSGKFEQALPLFEKAVRLYPSSAAAEHNLAAILGDMGRAATAETHARRAFEKGGGAPETWLVLARALLAQARLDEAQSAFEKVVELDPGMLVAHYELAQLIWMQTADSEQALVPLESTIARYPDTRQLYGLKAQVLMYTRGAADTHAFLESVLARWPDDAGLIKSAIDAATMSGQAEGALQLSERLMSLQPDSASTRVFRAYALLAAGKAEEALGIAEQLCNDSPNDQHAVGLLAIACRITGDPRYEALYDYEQFVRAYTIATPDGWSSLSDYLADLAGALRDRHPFKSHPFSNSAEHGSKIADLLEIDDPAIAAFESAITPAIDEHLRHLGKGDDVLRRRNTGAWKIDGIWSVWLQPDGFHHNHLHPTTWLSSACYIELPDRVDSGGQEGWIKFGEPGPVTSPALPAEFQVQPSAGLLVLFPSYMWHGTIPFSGSKRRLSIAFDLVPA